MPKLRRKISLAFLSFGFALLLAELAVRALPFLPITSMGTVMRRDLVLDHSLRPGARGRMTSREYDVPYAINEFGFRDDLPEEDAVLILGDSFMEGYGVRQEETLAARLEALGVPSVNAGVKSYSPALEYIFLRHRGLALNPDTVLLFLDLSDPANDAYYLKRAVFDAQGPVSIRPRETRIPLPHGTAAVWLEEHSALWQYALHSFHKYFPASEEDIGYAGQANGVDVLFPGRDSLSDSEYFRAEWKILFQSLILIRDLLKENEVSFAIVTYPYGHQVSADAWSEGRKGHKFPPGISSDRPFRYIESQAAALGIKTFSLDQAFRAHPDPGKLYFAFDGHWTAEGHDFAARRVREMLADWHDSTIASDSIAIR